LCEATAHLRDFYRMLLSGVKYRFFTGSHNLSYTSEAMKRRRIQNAISIPFKGTTLIFVAYAVTSKRPAIGRHRQSLRSSKLLGCEEAETSTKFHFAFI
jgi:hypothetical protein